MSLFFSNTTDFGLPEGAQSAGFVGNFDMVAGDPKDFHLPAEVLLSIYGHEYFSSHRTLWVRNCLIVLYCIFSAVGVLMNVCVVSLLVAWHQKALRNITNTFVLALASSDIVMSGFNMPMQTFYELIETVQFSEVTCRVVFSTFGLPMHISCLVILVIGIDRYWIIIYPLRRRMTRLTAAGMLILIVTISLISVIPIAVFSTSSPAAPLPNVTHYRYCVEYWPSPEVRLMYSIMTFLVQFLLPLVLTATLYARIYIRLHERRFRKRDLERKKRTNKILVGIVVCFFVCWTPWTVFSLTLEVHTYWTQKDFQNGTLQQEVKEAPVAISTAHVQKLLLSCLQGLQKHQQNGVLEMSSLAACPDYNTSVLASESLLLFGRHTKLIDLLLKLLAMCSSCLNPCLYGCMTETMRMVMKKTMRRMHSLQNWISKLHGSWPPSGQVSTTSKRDRQKMGLFENYRSESFAVPVYIMQCCGFHFVVRTGFHQQHEQARNLLKQKDDTEASAGHTKPGGKMGYHHHHHQYAQRRHHYRSHCPGSVVPGGGLPAGCEVQVTPVNTRKHFVQNLHETHQLTSGVGIPTGQKASGSSSGNGDKDHHLCLQQLEPASLSFTHRGSATLSLTEQSTKRTSLLPSSVTERTPRNSLLIARTNSGQAETSNVLSEAATSKCKPPTASTSGEGGFEMHVAEPNRHAANPNSQPVIVVCEVTSTDGDDAGTSECLDSVRGPNLISESHDATRDAFPEKMVDGPTPQLAGTDLRTGRLSHLKLVNIEVHVEDTAAIPPPVGTPPAVRSVDSNCNGGNCYNGPAETVFDSLTASGAGGVIICKSETALYPYVYPESSSGLITCATSTPRPSLVRNFKMTQSNLAPLEEISGYATSNELETSASDGRGSASTTSRGGREGRKSRSGKRTKCMLRKDRLTGTECQSSKEENSLTPIGGISSKLLPKPAGIVAGRNLWQNVKRRSIFELRQKPPMPWKRSQSISSTSDTVSHKSLFRPPTKSTFGEQMPRRQKTKALERTGDGFDRERPDCSAEAWTEKKTRPQKGNWKCKESFGKSDESSDDFAHFHKLALQEAMQNAKGSAQDQRRSSGEYRRVGHLGRRISLPWLLRSESCRRADPQ
ncbi:hypothetical protein SprV_0602239900 [Sparganum proliferum]